MVRYLMTLLAFLVAGPALAADIQVSSDRNPVGLNESFQLVYQSADEVDGEPDFSVLEEQLDVISRSQSNNVSIINGQYSRSQSWNLTVMARQTGTLQLPPVPFGNDLSATLTIEVNAASKLSTGGSDFHTRVRLSSETPLVQQQLIVTQQLFSPYNLSNYALGDLQFDGVDVVIEPLGDAKQYRTRVGGTAYIVVEKRFAVFPQQSGELILQPALVEGRTGARGGSLFDPFGSRGQILRARSEQKQVQVRPLPDGINLSPWLPARSLELVEQWPQNAPRVTVGEPLTRTLSIKAEGLTAAQLPELPLLSSDGLKQYPDQPLLENIRNDNGITGYRVEKTALIPTRPGRVTLPEIEIAWWNTETGQLETSRIPSRTLQVLPSADAPAEPVQPTTVETEAVQQGPDPVVSADSEVSEPPQIMAAADPSHWLWIAAFTTLGWLATGVSWWAFSRREATESAENTPDPAKDSRRVFKHLVKACAEGDARRVREHLLQWGRAEFGEQASPGLSQLATHLPMQLADQLRQLDAGLYAPDGSQVDLEQLAASLKQFDKSLRSQQASGKPTSLEPLYYR